MPARERGSLSCILMGDSPDSVSVALYASETRAKLGYFMPMFRDCFPHD